MWSRIFILVYLFAAVRTQLVNRLSRRTAWAFAISSSTSKCEALPSVPRTKAECTKLYRICCKSNTRDLPVKGKNKSCFFSEYFSTESKHFFFQADIFSNSHIWIKNVCANTWKRYVEKNVRNNVVNEITSARTCILRKRNNNRWDGLQLTQTWLLKRILLTRKM